VEQLMIAAAAAVLELNANKLSGSLAPLLNQLINVLTLDSSQLNYADGERV
jgi:hypothetical protein